MLNETISKVKFFLPDLNLQEYQILILPENISYSDSALDLYDAHDSLLILKDLKNLNVKIANFDILGLSISTKERRSSDKWFGHIYVRDTLALPILIGLFTSVVGAGIYDRIDKKENFKVHTTLEIEKKDGSTIKLNYDGDGETLVKMLEKIDVK